MNNALQILDTPPALFEIPNLRTYCALSAKISNYTIDTIDLKMEKLLNLIQKIPLYIFSDIQKCMQLKCNLQPAMNKLLATFEAL